MEIKNKMMNFISDDKGKKPLEQNEGENKFGKLLNDPWKIIGYIVLFCIFWATCIPKHERTYQDAVKEQLDYVRNPFK